MAAVASGSVLANDAIVNSMKSCGTFQKEAPSQGKRLGSSDPEGFKKRSFYYLAQGNKILPIINRLHNGLQRRMCT